MVQTGKTVDVRIALFTRGDAPGQEKAGLKGI